MGCPFTYSLIRPCLTCCKLTLTKLERMAEFYFFSCKGCPASLGAQRQCWWKVFWLTSPIGSLGDLTRALKSATSKPRFFRSLRFWRWAVAAVAAQQITLPQVLAHQDVVLQICEQERLRSRPPYAGFLYDEMARKQGSEVQKLDKESSRKLSHRGWAQCCAWQLWKSLAARLQGPKRASCRDSWPPHAKEGRRSHQKLGQCAEEVLAKAAAATAGLSANRPAAILGRQLSRKQQRKEEWAQRQQARRSDQDKRKQERGHNSPFLHMLADGVLCWQGPRVKLRGLVWLHGKLQFRTHLAQTYPA